MNVNTLSLLFFLLLSILFFLVKIHVIKYAYEKIQISPYGVFLLLFFSLLGSYVNIPLWQVHSSPHHVTLFTGLWSGLPSLITSKTTIAINLGGAIIPIFISLYLMVKVLHPKKTLLATLIVSLIVYYFSRVVPGVGITIPILLPALSAALSSLLLDKQETPQTAYISGSIGTLIGADLANLSKIKDFIGSLNKPDKPIEKRANEKIQDFTRTKLELKKDFLLIDKKLENIDYKLAKCCNPIYGDKIFGFVTVGAGTKIHRLNCPNAKRLFERYPYRILESRWAHTSSKTSFLTVIDVTGIDKMGIVNNISKVISSDLQVDMKSITIETQDGIFQGRISVYVNNIDHLDTLIKNLMKIKGLLKVERVNN